MLLLISRVVEQFTAVRLLPVARFPGFLLPVRVEHNAIIWTVNQYYIFYILTDMKILST